MAFIHRVCKAVRGGSGAAIKFHDIIHSLNSLPADERGYGLELHVVTTRTAKFFLDVPAIRNTVTKLYDDETLWKTWNKAGDPVMHVELAKLADLMVIAPLNSNTMGKVANGICNNMLTVTVRSWDSKKPLIFCPSMNCKMWNHPITQKYITTLKSWGYIEVPPISKNLMCGDVGPGALAQIPDIVEAILKVTDAKFKAETKKQQSVS